MKIKYKFATETVEIEVADDWGNLVIDLDRQEYNNDHAETRRHVSYRILLDGQIVGGVIIHIDKETAHNELDTLFVLPNVHSKGIGYGAWLAIEALHPETKVWKTCTPYFDKRNIHFYVNKCGFQIDEFWCEYFKPSEPMPDEMPVDEGPDEMFHFVKVMK